MGKKRMNPASGLFWRIALSAVGVLLILMAVGNLYVYLVGEKTRVFDVKTRRIGGSDANQAPGSRYQWDISYSFRDRSGAVHHGYAKRRGSDSGTTVEKTVYYLPAAPFFNVLESQGRPNAGQAVMLVLGGFLLYVMNRKRVKGK